MRLFPVTQKFSLAGRTSADSSGNRLALSLECAPKLLLPPGKSCCSYQKYDIDLMTDKATKSVSAESCRTAASCRPGCGRKMAPSHRLRPIDPIIAAVLWPRTASMPEMDRVRPGKGIDMPGRALVRCGFARSWRIKPDAVDFLPQFPSLESWAGQYSKGESFSNTSRTIKQNHRFAAAAPFHGRASAGNLYLKTALSTLSQYL